MKSEMRNRIVLLIVAMCFVVVGLIFPSPLSSFIHKPIFDKDILYERSGVKYQMSVIENNDGIQSTTFYINEPDRYYGEQPVWIIPVPAPVEDIEIGISDTVPVYVGYDVRIAAKHLITYIIWSISKDQIYPVLVTHSLWNPFMGYDTLYDEINEELFSIEEKLNQITDSCLISVSGLTTAIFDTAHCGPRNYEFHKLKREFGICGGILSGEKLREIIKNKKEGRNLSEFEHLMQEYIDREFSFLVYGIADLEAFKRKYPRQYLRLLLRDEEYERARDFLKNFPVAIDAELFEQAGDQAIESCDEKFHEKVELRVLWNILNKDTVIDGLLADWLKFGGWHIQEEYERGNRPGLWISFPTNYAFVPQKVFSIYGQRHVPLITYIGGFVEPKLEKRVKKSTHIEFFKEKWGGPFHYTKLRNISESETIKEDQCIVLKAPMSARVALYLCNAYDADIDYSSFHYSNEKLFIISVWILSFILSVLAAIISSTIFFRNTGIPRWRYLVLSLFHLLSILGFCAATLFVRTKAMDRDTKDKIQEARSLGISIEKRRFYFFFVISGLLSLVLGFGGSMGFPVIVIAWVFWIGLFAILFMTLSSSWEKLCISHSNDGEPSPKYFNVIDIKRFIFLVSSIFLISHILWRVLKRMLDNKLYLLDYLEEFSIIPLSFCLALFFIIVANMIQKYKLKGPGLFVVPADRKKVWFVIVFSLSFLGLCAILLYGLRCFLS